jgi:non-canonical purine NTP pyrophosphatase (RdgB/HAM1 family)
MRHRIVFFTENHSKHTEVAEYLASNSDKYGNIIMEHCPPPLTTIKEIQSLDREEIVHGKLLSIGLMTQHREVKPAYDDETVWIVAEDTSLTIEKLGGFPGPFIKFFLQSMSLLDICELTRNSPASSIVSLSVGKLEKTGYFIIDKMFEWRFFEGIINGVISYAPRGINGFGFDPIFVPTLGYNPDMKTNAELTPTEKNNINPRIKAFEALFNWLLEQKEENQGSSQSLDTSLNTS